MTNDLPVMYDDHSIYNNDVSNLKTKSVTLLLSLLERVDDPFVPSRILKALEIDKLIGYGIAVYALLSFPRDL